MRETEEEKKNKKPIRKKLIEYIPKRRRAPHSQSITLCFHKYVYYSKNERIDMKTAAAAVLIACAAAGFADHANSPAGAQRERKREKRHGLQICILVRRCSRPPHAQRDRTPP